MKAQTPKVKICGVRRIKDALTAAEAGADFIGLVFVPNRRRRVSVEQARRVVDAVKSSKETPPKMVGLFADQPLPNVLQTIEGSGVEMVQLCGAESADFCAQMPVPVFKVVHVPAGALADAEMEKLKLRVTSLGQVGHRANLDREVVGLHGGTGQSFDWSVAAQLGSEGLEFMLAGGLTPENVSRAVRQVRPWGVDVSSGVETDGAKDSDKIRRFIAEAKGAFA